MLPFVLASVGFVALLLVFSVPAVLVARRDPRRHPGVVRKFVIGAVLTGLVCGSLYAISDRLVDQCLAEGNTQCHDAGGTGILVMIAGGFLAVSSARAYFMYTD
jgi:hypothetical protein